MTQKDKIDRAARAYEKVLSLDAEQPGGRRAPDPDLRSRPTTRRGSPRRSRSSSATTTIRTSGSRSCVRSRSSTRRASRTSRKAFERYLAAFEIAPGDEQSQADVERAAKLTGRWDEVSRGVPRRDRREPTSERDAVAPSRCGCGSGACSSRRCSASTTRSPSTAPSTTASRRTPTRSARSSGSTGRPSAGASCSTSTRRSASSSYDPDERKQILYEIAKLYESELGDRQGDRHLQRGARRRAGRRAALAALDVLYSETKDVGAVRRRPAPAHRARRQRRAARSTSSIRLAQTLARAPRRRRRRARELPRDPVPRRATTRARASRSRAAAEQGSARRGRGDPREHLRGARRLGEALGALEILRRRRREPERRSRSCARSRATAAGQLGALDRARSTRRRARSRKIRRSPSRALELEQLAEQAQRLGQADRDLRRDRRRARATRRSRATTGCAWRRSRSSSARSTRRRRATSRSSRSIPPTPRRWRRWTRSIARTGRWDDLIGVFRRRIELTDDADEREALYAQMAHVYEEKLGRPDDAIAAYSEVLALDPTSQVALAALDGALHAPGACGASSPRTSRRSSARRDRRGAARADAAPRGAARARDGPGRAGDRGLPPGARARSGERGALGALERLGQRPGARARDRRDPRAALPPAGRLPEAHRRARSAGAPRRRRRRARSSSSTRSRSSTRTPPAISNAAFDTLARALAVDPAHEATQQGLDRLARATGRFQDLAQVFEQLAAAARGSRARQPALHACGARVYENDVGDVDRAIELYRKVLSIDPTNLARPSRSSAVPADRALRRPVADPAAQGGDPRRRRRSRRRRSTRRRRSRRRCSSAPEHAIAVYLKILELDAEDLRSIDALVKLYLGLSRWEELLERLRQEGRSGRRPRREEAHLLPGRRGLRARAQRRRARHRHLPAGARARSRRPHGARAPRRALPDRRELAGAAQRPQHEAELTADPAEAVSFQYRIAELYEKHLDDVERAVELYREILNIQPDHAPTLPALEGIKNGERGRSPRPRCSSRSTTRWASGQKLISVLEVQVRFADDRVRRGRAPCTASRASTKRAWATTRARSTPTRARSRSTARTRRSLGVARAPGDGDRALAGRGRALRRRARQARRASPSASSSSGCAWRRSTRCSSRTSSNAVARYRRVLEVDPENQNAVRALDRLFTQTERWASWPRSWSARPRSARAPRRSSSSSSASGRSTSCASATSTRRSPPTAR